ncbi:MAG: circularly permuted type 2 ATP-grasp protein [Deltaproteobacteria bacterium]|nr:circularly permuted type 2 ATP-grasp protein [Deltaproteobacteria bacterium]
MHVPSASPAPTTRGRRGPPPKPPTSSRGGAGAPSAGRKTGLFAGYRPPVDTYDEIFDARGAPRPGLDRVVRLLEGIGPNELRTRQRLADEAFLKSGVTFSVYADQRGVERIFPFDLVPRVVSAREWEPVRRGLEQRVRALNAFLADVYGDQRILAEGRIPRHLVEASKGFLPAMRGIRPPGGVYVHVAGIDLIRRPDGTLVVLEDNVRTPSGVSYVLENRTVMKRVLPRIFAEARVRPVDEYPLRLREALVSVSPVEPTGTRTVILTPGQHNSAYFEHTFLARRMGCDLVQGQDLFVWHDKVYVKTTRGPSRVDVIYRRVDDAFLDPEVFRADSLLGVPGLVRAYAKGNVAIANAIGNGVADDKAVYPFVPEMVRFYLSEEPLLPQVETYVCDREKDLSYVLANLPSLVVKSVDESGGYGMLMGPQASKKELAEHARRIRQSPRGYIAQPLVELSSCPTWCGNGIAPRRVDLRPYVVTGRSTWVLPGGLTRVALVEGSYVVNSSQGGGSKDTWVLEDQPR